MLLDQLIGTAAAGGRLDLPPAESQPEPAQRPVPEVAVGGA